MGGSELARFQAKVKRVRRTRRRGVVGPCHIWTAAKNSDGYGVFRRDDGRLELAHRVAVEHDLGPADPGLEHDHVCEQTDCVNPAHIERVTHRENITRAMGFDRRRRCRRGHPLTPANIAERATGRRQCRRCLNVARRRRYAELKAAA